MIQTRIMINDLEIGGFVESIKWDPTYSDQTIFLHLSINNEETDQIDGHVLSTYTLSDLLSDYFPNEKFTVKYLTPYISELPDKVGIMIMYFTDCTMTVSENTDKTALLKIEYDMAGGGMSKSLEDHINSSWF